MKLKYIWLVLILLVNLSSLNSFTFDQAQLTDFRVEPTLVRVISIVVIEYSYIDKNGSQKKDNFCSGGVGTGILITEKGVILTSGLILSRVYDFQTDTDTFIKNITNILVQRIVTREDSKQLEDKQISGWTRSRSFRIINSKAHKLVVLTNKNLADFEIGFYSSENDDHMGLGIINVDLQNLPIVNFANAENIETGNKVNLYYFPGTVVPDELLKFYLDPLVFLKVLKKSGKIINKEYFYRKIPVFQTDMSFDYSNTGGIITNSEGRAIGLISIMAEVIDRAGSFKKVENFNFFIPSEKVFEITNREGIEINGRSIFNNTFSKLTNSIVSENWSQASQEIIEVDSYLAGCPVILEIKEIVENQKLKKKRLEAADKFKLVVIIIIGVIVLLFIIIITKFLKKKAANKKDRKEIDKDKPWVQNVSFDTTLIEADDLEVIGDVDILIRGEKIKTSKVIAEQTKIGRDPSQSDIIISEAIISKLHCIIFKKEDDIFVKDNNSTNGTYLYNQRITTEKIKDNDVICLGRRGTVKLLFHKK